MRFAGTCKRYSNKAIPQLAMAATYHLWSFKFLRCAYQANVIKTLEAVSRSTVRTMTGIGLRTSGGVLPKKSAATSSITSASEGANDNQRLTFVDAFESLRALISCRGCASEHAKHLLGGSDAAHAWKDGVHESGH